jgi:hypothetical protein
MTFKCVPAGLLAIVVGCACPGAGLCGPANQTRVGQWVEQTQLAADEMTQALVRRQVRIWSPPDLVGFDVSWRPKTGPGIAADRTADGSGRLEWRVAGSSPNDTASVVATYVGEVRRGKPSGYGTYHDRTGLAYEGLWREGFMSGSGVLRTPDGTDYQGEMRVGKPDGNGRETSPDGVYEGSFVAGLRDGAGVLTYADGTRLTGLWRGGAFSGPIGREYLRDYP